MSDYINQITQLEKKIADSKIEKAKLEEREKSLKEEKTKILAELKVYEVSEKELGFEIVKIEEEIKEQLTKCEEMLK